MSTKQIVYAGALGAGALAAFNVIPVKTGVIVALALIAIAAFVIPDATTA